MLTKQKQGEYKTIVLQDATPIAKQGTKIVGQVLQYDILDILMPRMARPLRI